jgi:DNA-binding transcriptional LysR family regulator
MQPKSLHLKSLEVFCDVARLESMSQAAAAHRLTQSAASQIVRQLEKRLGAQLINRAIRPLQLTPLGRIYYEGCKRLLEQYQDLEASIRGARTGVGATVLVAAIYSVGLGDMNLYVERFVAEHPEVNIPIKYVHPKEVYARVLAGTADLGLISFPRRSRELMVVPWRNEEMVLACPPSHPLAREVFIRPPQLQGEKYVGFDKNLVIRRQVDRFLRDQGVTVDVVMEFDNIENIKKALMETEEGVALLPEPTLRREAEAGALAALPLAGARLVRPLAIIHRRNQTLSSTARGFLDLLQQTNETEASSRPDARQAAGDNGSPMRSPSDQRSRNGAARSHKDRTT